MVDGATRLEYTLRGEIMLIEEMRDQWICSCGNWVGRQVTWCPECCEDRDVQKEEEQQEQEATHGPFDD